MESRDWRAAPGELNSPHVEPILKKYLELRYRLMPYLYTAVKETTETGLPLMRALWLHFPDDSEAVARGDELRVTFGFSVVLVSFLARSGCSSLAVSACCSCATGVGSFSESPMFCSIWTMHRVRFMVANRGLR